MKFDEALVQAVMTNLQLEMKHLQGYLNRRLTTFEWNSIMAGIVTAPHKPVAVVAEELGIER